MLKQHQIIIAEQRENYIYSGFKKTLSTWAKPRLLAHTRGFNISGCLVCMSSFAGVILETISGTPNTPACMCIANIVSKKAKQGSDLRKMHSLKCFDTCRDLHICSLGRYRFIVTDWVWPNSNMDSRPQLLSRSIRWSNIYFTIHCRSANFVFVGILVLLELWSTKCTVRKE